MVLNRFLDNGPRTSFKPGLQKVQRITIDLGEPEPISQLASHTVVTDRDGKQVTDLRPEEF